MTPWLCGTKLTSRTITACSATRKPPWKWAWRFCRRLKKFSAQTALKPLTYWALLPTTTKFWATTAKAMKLCWRLLLSTKLYTVKKIHPNCLPILLHWRSCGRLRRIPTLRFTPRWTMPQMVCRKMTCTVRAIFAWKFLTTQFTTWNALSTWATSARRKTAW